jgi:hypothetical protein
VRIWGAIGAAVVAVALVGAAQTSAGKSVLRGAGLMSGPERYTELAFARPSKLPGALPARGRMSVAVPFTLRNAEGASRTYRWTIEAGGNILARGRVSAAPGERAVIRRRLSLGCRGARTRVEVRLAAPSESIGFWARCR